MQLMLCTSVILTCHAVDPLAPQISETVDERGQVLLGSSRREGTWEGEQNDRFAEGEELRGRNLLVLVCNHAKECCLRQCTADPRRRATEGGAARQARSERNCGEPSHCSRRIHVTTAPRSNTTAVFSCNRAPRQACEGACLARRPQRGGHRIQSESEPLLHRNPGVKI